MPIFSLLVKAQTVAEFFKRFKNLKCDVDSLKAVVLLPSGLEVTFVSEAALRGFLNVIEGKEWEVVCELKATTIVTLAPRGQGGHALISDEAVVSFLRKYGSVLEGKRLHYKDFPTVQTGVRQFRVKLGDKPIPSSVSFGRAAFFLSYQGQDKTCFKCQKTGHQAKDCSDITCHKCGREGHTVKECKNLVKCIVCDKEGHTFRNCPSSYSGALKLGSKFSKIANDDAVNEPVSDSAVSVRSDSEPMTPGTENNIDSAGFSQDSTTESQFVVAANLADADNSNDSLSPSQDLFLSQNSLSVPNPSDFETAKSKRSASSDESDTSFSPLVIDESEQLPPTRKQLKKEAKRRKSAMNRTVSASEIL